MNINKIYVFIPGGLVTGGPETLHQFAAILTEYYSETYIKYIGDKVPYDAPDKYKKYNVKHCEDVEDTAENIIIAPESMVKDLIKYQNSKQCVFWLSLDYYIRDLKPYLWIVNSQRKFFNKSYWYIRNLFLYYLRKISNKLNSIDKLNKDAFHLFNCEYVRKYLLSKGIDGNNIMYLCGPLEKLYFEPLDKESVLLNKENIIAYNPAKDHKYITQLQKVNTNNYQFVPIKGMTSQQVKELLLRAKLYVDFGYFPGPERIPRQAAMCYCSILTSNLGSAANDVDVPIPRENKIDVKHFKPKEVYKKVISLIENFEQDFSDYDKYREKVIRQDLDFEQSIEQFIQRYSD